MESPTKKRFLAWYKYRFPRNFGKSFDKDYQREWEGRFRSPRYAWNSSDMQTRKSLIKFFPKTFKGLKLSDNLYNEEWGDKFTSWSGKKSPLRNTEPLNLRKY